MTHSDSLSSAHENLNVAHWCFLSLHKSTWVLVNEIVILGIRCAMGKVLGCMIECGNRISRMQQGVQ